MKPVELLSGAGFFGLLVFVGFERARRKRR
jgi:MYXO-CTERM domain-containing protein